jgi:hypothetical protein
MSRKYSPELSPKTIRREAEELGFKSKSIWLSSLGFYQLYQALDFDLQNANPELSVVAQAYNHNYLGDRERKDLSPRLVWVKT